MTPPAADERQVEFCGDDQTADRLLDLYCDDTATFRIPQAQGIWPAVRMAHDAGLRGKGRTVAVLDSAPDLARGRLKNRVTLAEPPRNPPDSHGTVVDLFVLSVAPEADILHFDVTIVSNGTVRPSPRRIQKALCDPRLADVDVICLSLGTAPKKIVYPEFYDKISAAIREKLIMGPLLGDPVADAETVAQRGLYPAPTAQRCGISPCYCKLIEEDVSPAPAIVAAAGNASVPAFCPALSQRALSVGFQTDLRTDTGETVVADQAPPSYDQARLADFNLMQVHPDERSSFAAPRAAGLLALIGRDLTAARLILPAKVIVQGWQLDLQMRAFAEFGIEPKIPIAEMRPALQAIYRAAFATLPDLGTSAAALTPAQRLAFQVFVGHDLTNAGYHLMNVGALEDAARYSRMAVDLMPWADEPASNLAAILYHQACILEQHKAPPATIFALLEEALKSVTQALEHTQRPALQASADRIKEMHARYAAA